MSKLEELRQAFSLATPGVWLSKDDHAPNMAAVGTGEAGWLGLAQMFGDTQSEANANAAFIALAHNNMAALLEAVELLESLASENEDDWDGNREGIAGYTVTANGILEKLK